MFVLSFLPAGLVGFIFVAIISALMSSLDSAINSLSAVSVDDFYKRYFKKEASERHYLTVSKIFTVFWGVFCITAALVFASVGESTRQTTIVLINAVGSLLYGPILAAFLTGLLSKKIKAFDIKAGIVVGLVFNLVLWRFSDVSWLWWNAGGFLATVISGYIVNILGLGKVALVPARFLHSYSDIHKKWMPVYFSVVAYFFIIILVSYFIERV
jgi:Na+/proline symporter